MRQIFIGIIVFVFAGSISNPLSSQTVDSITAGMKEKFYIDLYLGVQVSGIRKEDYVASNFAPYIQLSAGKWLTRNLALALTYQGPYFNFIGDSSKHKYVYLGGDAILNINRFFTESNTGVWNINVFAGPGLLYNDFYSKTNFCFSTGLVNEVKIKNDISLKFKVSAIIGHSIYQKDEDILPNISLGLSKTF
jgi:hypothetical protein